MDPLNGPIKNATEDGPERSQRMDASDAPSRARLKSSGLVALLK
jgi:hypothetical protein